MKTLRTIAAVIVAFVLVLGPTVAFAATTITATPNATTYSGQATIQISGTVSPAPSSSSSGVVVTTNGPAGVADTGTTPVAAGTGTYTYTYVSGGNVAWVTGTYTVNATWGFGGVTATTTTTFSYTAATSGGGGANRMGVSIQASTPVVAGSTVYIAILTSSPTGTLDDVSTWAPLHIHYPDNSLHNICTAVNTPANCIGAFTRVHTGFYSVNFTLPTTALAGLYSIHAGTTDANGVTGEGLGSFTVQATSTTSPDGPALAQIQASLTTLTSSVNGLTGSLGTITSSLGTINTEVQGLSGSGTGSGNAAITTSLNTISAGVTNIQSTLGGLSTGLSQLNTVGTQLTNLNNAVNNNQTYVLVVAALAAITLVLELAILVRKLS